MLALILSRQAIAQSVSALAPGAEAVIAQLDSAMCAGLARDRIPGGAYVLVLGGRVVASRGFGVTDTRSRQRVHPDSTVFGLASTTKLFTAIAAARLARDGRLDLDASIEPYLRGGQLASRVDNVTVSRLLTHTAGYDDPTIGSGARSASGILPLAGYLDRSLSPPWIPAGTHTSYSNVGVALAGHILSIAASSSFAGLLDSAVFLPFGMTRTSVRQPLPQGMEASRAIPYSSSGDRQMPVPRIFFNDVPASGAYATAHDMGLLMQRLVAPPTSVDSALVNTLFSRRFTNHPALPGMTLGFRESVDAADIFEHGGDWQDYSNALYLDTRSRTGLFAVFSSSDGSQAALDMWTIVRSALPARPNRYSFTRPASGTSAAGRCSSVAGTYRDTRMSRHSLARLGVLTGDVRELAVSAAPSGISIGGRAYQEMGGGVFQSDSGRTVAFRCANNEAASHVFIGRAQSSAYRRVSTGESRGAQGALLLIAFIATAGAVVADVRRRRRRNDIVDSIARSLRITASAAAVVLLLALVVMLVSTSPWAFQYGVPDSIAFMLTLSRFVVGAAAIGLIATLVAVVRPGADAGVLEAVLAVPVVLLVILMVQWSLVSLQGSP